MASRSQLAVSLRWTAIVSATLLGTAGLLALIVAPWLERLELVGLFAVAAALGAGLLTRVADRPLRLEVALGSLLGVVLLFVGDHLIPGLEFVDGTGERPIVVIAVVVALFANLGGRVGGRHRSENPLLGGLAFGLAFVGCYFFYLVLLGALNTFGPKWFFDSMIFGLLLVPTLAAILFQSAHARRLPLRVFALGPIAPALVLLLCSLRYAPEPVGAAAVATGGVFLAGAACMAGGSIGRALVAAPPPPTVPTATAT